jgi:ketosteroid isomerase-like protein
MIKTLPAPIAAYLAADRAKDADGVAQAFAADAHVRDEHHDYHGREAIRAWKVTSQAKYQYTVEPLTFAQEGEGGILHARLSGTFPGSPVEVDYRFTLADDAITTLEIL